MTDQKPLLTRGNIIGLVRQVADPDKEDPLHNDLITLTLDEMERLASLVAERVAAVEREACAQVCDEKSAKVLSMQMGNDPHDLPNVMLRHQSVAHLEDAAAIRARGEA